jgi:2-dehydro-3-deoxyphosphooctonate aldolase (KDO 8-P synthase)
MARILYRELQEDTRFFLIAGPCVIESAQLLDDIAKVLHYETKKRGINLIFKASWKKANRTSMDSYTGPGLKKGLQLLADIKNKYDLPIITDVHESQEVAEVAEVADIIQIPAFLSRQTDLLVAAGNSGRIINIKKGQFMAPEDMKPAAQKVLSTGNEQVLLCERGTSFGYHNLIVDFRSFSIMAQYGYPLVYDVTHSLQKPSLGKTSSGDPGFASLMAKAAIATGKVKGLFIETHPEPAQAKSDAGSMLPLSQLGSLLDECLNVMG